MAENPSNLTPLDFVGFWGRIVLFGSLKIRKILIRIKNLAQ